MLCVDRIRVATQFTSSIDVLSLSDIPVHIRIIKRIAHGTSRRRLRCLVHQSSCEMFSFFLFHSSRKSGINFGSGIYVFNEQEGERTTRVRTVRINNGRFA